MGFNEESYEWIADHLHALSPHSKKILSVRASLSLAWNRAMALNMQAFLTRPYLSTHLEQVLELLEAGSGQVMELRNGK